VHVTTRRSTRRIAPVVALMALALGGCADRGLAAGPPSNTGTGTWAVVTFAAVAATVMLAALIVLPAMRPGGSVIGSWVLALQAGGVAVAAAILIGAAIRSEQLLDDPDAEQAASLLRLTTLDGRDSGFFTLMVLLTLVLGGLLIAVLVLTARFAADTDHLERVFASGLLTLEAAASAGSGVVVLLGFRHLGFVLPATALPVLVIAAVASWPREGTSGVEQPHG
jgi:hypothetical protein